MNAGVGVLALLVALFGIFFNHVWATLVVPLLVSVVNAVNPTVFATSTSKTTATATSIPS